MDSIQSVFEDFGGNLAKGFPRLPASVSCTEQGTPYLTMPGVTVLAHTQIALNGLADFLADYRAGHFADYLDDPAALSDGSQLCKVAGQLCYLSFGPQRTTNAQATGYFEKLKASGHGSVFEHANYTLLLYGVSRSLTHELVRHRHLSFSQVSQRYVSARLARFVERPEYASDATLHTQFLNRIDRAASDYKALVEAILEKQAEGLPILAATERTDLRKKVQQTARSVLPNETEAPIIVTGNARAWRHVIEMRGSVHAETEMRALAVRVLLCLALTDPLLFEDYALDRLPDGTFAVKTVYAKI